MNIDPTGLIANLNPEQIQVVEHDLGPCLVAAVAGSGKTTAVVHRIAYLSAIRGVEPSRILATTFSKKAADEMTARTAKLLGENSVQIQTFHSLCRKILVDEYPGFREMKLDESGEQYRVLLKKTVGYEHMKWRTADVEDLMRFVEIAKSHGYGPADEGALAIAIQRSLACRAAPHREPQLVIQAYEIAESMRIDSAMMTFSDWLVVAEHILRTRESSRLRWEAKFDRVIVDEGQDNNTIQNRIVTILASLHRNLMVVGDSGQSIYGWRGAAPRAFTGFPRVWDGCKVISMNRNYRCGGDIVAVANDALSAMRPDTRCGELMVAEMPHRGVVALTGYESQEDEARAIVEEIKTLKRSDQQWSSTVILYRTNMLSRATEEILIKEAIPYHIVGSISFYRRKEVANLLAYLRVAWRKGASMDDVRRSLYAPSRFLGKVFLSAIEQAGRTQPAPASFGEMVERAIGSMARITTGQKNAARDWGMLIESLRRRIAADGDTAKPGSMIDYVVKQTQYIEWIRRDEGRESVDNDRVSNVAELVRAAEPFATVGEFLEHVHAQSAAFDASKKNESDGQDRLTLMSVHRSKGLEWDNVFLITCNNHVMPHVLADDVDEERRIFYVAATRARHTLHVSYVKSAVSRGQTRGMEPSPFIARYLEGPDQDRDDNYEPTWLWKARALASEIDPTP